MLSGRAGKRDGDFASFPLDLALRVAPVGSPEHAHVQDNRGHVINDAFRGELVTRKLVAGPDTGSVNLVKAAGVPLDTILAHFVVTLYTDHGSYLPANSPYSFKSYNFRQLITGTLIGLETTTSYLPVGAVGNGTTTFVANVPASSGAFALTSLSNGSARTIKITDTSGNPSTDPNGRVYVVRVK